MSTTTIKIPHKDNPSHVGNLESIALLEAQGFEGPDCSLEISLFEYGIAWRNLGDETLFIYGIKVNDDSGEYKRFDRGTFSNDLNFNKEFNWVKDWQHEIFCFIDVNQEIWDNEMQLHKKIQALVNVYGYENIFGTSYWEGFEIAE